MTRAHYLAAALLSILGTLTAGSTLNAQTKPAPLSRDEAVIYRDRGFSGPAVAISADNPDLGLAWNVGSIRVKSGRWQLCERTNYRGRCRTVASDAALLAIGGSIPVQSIRLAGSTGGGGSIGNGGPSLRGMASQYYTRPETYSQRVPACRSSRVTAACAAASADAFCRTMGWRGAAWQTIETVARRNYLADVMCVRTGY